MNRREFVGPWLALHECCGASSWCGSRRDQNPESENSISFKLSVMLWTVYRTFRSSSAEK